MNSKVLVPSIIITTNPEATKVFTSEEKKYTSFDKFKTDLATGNFYDSDEFIVIDSSNTDIISFNVDISSGESGGKGSQISVEFVPKQDEFEIRLLRSILNRYKNNSYFKDYPKNLFYVAFGVGDNLIYWSNFNAVTLASTSTFQEFNQPKTIQLNFTVSLGLNERLDLIVDQLLTTDTEIVSDLKISGNYVDGLFAKKWSLSDSIDIPIDTDENGKALLECMFGSTWIDYIYRKVIVDYLSAVFQQKKNIFIISPNLVKQIPNIQEKPSSADIVNTFEKDLKEIDYNKARLEIFEETGKKIDVLLGTETAPPRLVTEKVIDYESTRTTAVNTAIIVGGGAAAGIAGGPSTKTVKKYLGSIRFDSYTEESENKDYEALRSNIEQKIKELVSGLGRLTGESCSIVRESDVRFIGYFLKTISKEFAAFGDPSSPDDIAQFLGVPATPTTPSNRSSFLSEYLDPYQPLILIGPKSLVRSVLYGDPSTNNFNNTLETIPFNQFAFDYLTVSWKSLDLYASQAREEDISFLEDLVEKQNIKNLGISNFPVFRYNTVNSNVLSIKSDQTEMYNSFLYAGISKTTEFYSQAAVIEQAQIDQKNQAQFRVNTRLLDLIFNRRSADASGLFLPPSQGPRVPASDKVRKELLNELTAQVLLSEKKGRESAAKLISYAKKKGLIAIEGKNYDPEDTDISDDTTAYSQETDKYIAELIATFLSDEKNEEDYVMSNISIASADTLSDPALLYNQLLRFARNLSFVLKINTLPFFNISNQFWLGYPCLLFANRVSLLGATKNNPDILDRYLSGAYRIIGMKHQINASKCESEFTLARIPESELLKALEPEEEE